MSRTVSARIPKEMHDKLRDKCNDLGCSINDYMVSCIELVLGGSSEFDFGDEEDKGSGSDSGKKEEIPAIKPTKVSYDNGKTWIELIKKEENPKVIIRLDE